MHLTMDIDFSTIIGVICLFAIFVSFFLYCSPLFHCSSSNCKCTPLLQSVQTEKINEQAEGSSGSMIDVCMHCGHHGPKNELLCCVTCQYTTMHPGCISANQSDEFQTDFSDAWVCRECAINIAVFYQII
ncbi:hypothetical protein ABFS82_13G049900 [Erythranthe guttata]